MYTDAASLRRRSLQALSGPAVRSPLLIGVKSGLYVDAYLLVVWVVLLRCLASVVKRSSGALCPNPSPFSVGVRQGESLLGVFGCAL